MARAGSTGTISQVPAPSGGPTRYRGLAKTHLQHVATAAAVNLERLAAWFRAVPRRRHPHLAFRRLTRLRQRYP